MNNQQYEDLLHALGKEAFANRIKADIHRLVPEPYASFYYRQFDEAKNIADFLEYVAKQMRG